MGWGWGSGARLGAPWMRRRLPPESVPPRVCASALCVRVCMRPSEERCVVMPARLPLQSARRVCPLLAPRWPSNASPAGKQGPHARVCWLAGAWRRALCMKRATPARRPRLCVPLSRALCMPRAQLFAGFGCCAARCGCGWWWWSLMRCCVRYSHMGMSERCVIASCGQALACTRLSQHARWRLAVCSRTPDPAASMHLVLQRASFAPARITALPACARALAAIARRTRACRMGGIHLCFPSRCGCCCLLLYRVRASLWWCIALGQVYSRSRTICYLLGAPRLGAASGALLCGGRTRAPAGGRARRVCVERARARVKRSQARPQVSAVMSQGGCVELSALL